jgi:crossover junction endodeoxyribonuclease RusA
MAERERDVQRLSCVRFTVPLIPPSVNHYVKHTRNGRHYVTAEAKAFKEAVAIFAKGRVEADEYLVVSIVWLGAGQRGDVDNFPKVVLDALVDAGVIHSDAAVREIRFRKERDPKNPRTEIEVMAWNQI